MRTIYIFIMVMLTSCSSVVYHGDISIELIATTKNDRIAVKGEDFKGTLFTKEYKMVFHENDFERSSDISLKEIREAETAIRQGIRKANRFGINQGMNNCPVVHENLHNYFRQYIGYVNNKNHKIIHVNFYWNVYTKADKEAGYYDSRLNSESDYAFVLDGCSYYWSINVDLDTGKLYGLSVNGSA